MAQHAHFQHRQGEDFFFCDPHSPSGNAGRNENTNGLLRQYFTQEGTDLSRTSRS